MLPSPLAPKTIQRIGDELAIAWNDGGESFLRMEELRRNCPCAACGGEPDVMGRVVRPTVEYTAQSFDLREIEYIGGYAIQPRWGDGHRTGLYSWAYLRRLAESDSTGRGAES